MAYFKRHTIEISGVFNGRRDYRAARSLTAESADQVTLSRSGIRLRKPKKTLRIHVLAISGIPGWNAGIMSVSFVSRIICLIDWRLICGIVKVKKYMGDSVLNKF